MKMIHSFTEDQLLRRDSQIKQDTAEEILTIIREAFNHKDSDMYSMSQVLKELEDELL